MNLESYSFKTEPYAHQRVALEEAGDREYYAWLMEMGTGKTKVAIDNMAWLHLQGKVTGVLVIAPKGVYLNWVRSELPVHMPDEVDYTVVPYYAAPRKAEKEQMDWALEGDSTGLVIVAMNIEALRPKSKAEKYATSFLKRHFGKAMLIVDESTTIKNWQAKRTKSVINLGTYADYRRIMTGMAITQSPMDLYSQCRFLHPKALGLTSFYAFRSRYAELRTMRLNNHSFLQITGYQRLDELQSKLQTFSFRATKAECLDLPDKVYSKRYVELDAEQKKIYKQFKDDAYFEFENSDAIVAPIVLTKLLRLHQIACGFVQLEDGSIHDFGTSRLDALMDAITELQGKVLIWANYRKNVEDIQARLANEYGPETVATLYGDTPTHDRMDIVNKFQELGSDLRFIVGHPKTGGLGLTMTAATTVIYFSNNFDLELRMQSEDRAHRVGQKSTVHYIDLVAPDTIDEVVIQALRNKKSLSDKVLNEGWKSVFDLV